MESYTQFALGVLRRVSTDGILDPGIDDTWTKWLTAFKKSNQDIEDKVMTDWKVAKFDLAEVIEPSQVVLSKFFLDNIIRQRMMAWDTFMKGLQADMKDGKIDNARLYFATNHYLLFAVFGNIFFQLGAFAWKNWMARNSSSRGTSPSLNYARGAIAIEDLWLDKTTLKQFTQMAQYFDELFKDGLDSLYKRKPTDGDNAYLRAMIKRILLLGS